MISGINTWMKLQTRMVAAIRGFDRSWESCKKKYKVIYTEYKNDKRANEISGSDRHQECKFFEHFDMWNSTRACVKNQIPASATEGGDQNGKDKESELEDRETTPKQKKKEKFQDKLEVILEKVVSNSSSFLATFQESTALLKNMDRHMAAILEKL